MIHLRNKHFFNDTILDPQKRLDNKVIVAMEYEDHIQDISSFGVTFAANEQDIIKKVQPLINDVYKVDINKTHFVHKSQNYQSIFILPKIQNG